MNIVLFWGEFVAIMILAFTSAMLVEYIGG